MRTRRRIIGGEQGRITMITMIMMITMKAMRILMKVRIRMKVVRKLKSFRDVADTKMRAWKKQMASLPRHRQLEAERMQVSMITMIVMLMFMLVVMVCWPA